MSGIQDRQSTPELNIRLNVDTDGKVGPTDVGSLWHRTQLYVCVCVCVCVRACVRACACVRVRFSPHLPFKVKELSGSIMYLVLLNVTEGNFI
jgi:hypothetical protein